MIIINTLIKIELFVKTLTKHYEFSIIIINFW